MASAREICLITMVTFLSRAQLSYSRKAPLATELDLLWDKYGEVRGQLAVMESQKTVEADKVTALQQHVTSLQRETTRMEEEIAEITNDLQSILGSDEAQDDRIDETVFPEWRMFEINLKRGSVQMNNSFIVYAVDIETEVPPLYIWVEDNIPILDDEKYSRVYYTDGNIHTLKLRYDQSDSTARTKQITLHVQSHSHTLVLTFQDIEYSYFRVYDHELSYRIGSIHTRNSVNSGRVEFQAESLVNKTIEPSIDIRGLTNNGSRYESVSGISWLSDTGETSGPSSRLLNLTTGTLEADTYRVTYDLLDEPCIHGCLLYYTILVETYDDVFAKVMYSVCDSKSYRHGMDTFPVGTLVFFKGTYPYREFKLHAGESSVISCGAIGNPTPRIAILKLNKDGRETVTGYHSAVSRGPSQAYIWLVIKPTTPEVANISFVCAATSGGSERRLTLQTKMVIPPKFLKYEVGRGQDEHVVVRLFINKGDHSKPSVSCRENDARGEFIWGKPDMYSFNETTTDTGYVVTISANMAATSAAPTRFVCRVFNENGTDRLIVPVHL